MCYKLQGLVNCPYLNGKTGCVQGYDKSCKRLVVLVMGETKPVGVKTKNIKDYKRHVKKDERTSPPIPPRTTSSVPASGGENRFVITSDVKDVQNHPLAKENKAAAFTNWLNNGQENQDLNPRGII